MTDDTKAHVEQAKDNPAPETAPAGQTVFEAAMRDAEQAAPASVAGDVPVGVRLAAAWSWRLLATAAAILGLLWLASYLSLVMIPIVVALLLSALLAPLVRLLGRWRVPRSLGAAAALIGGVAVVTGILTWVVNEFVEGWPELSSKAAGGIGKLRDLLAASPLHVSERQLNGLLDEAQRWLVENKGMLGTQALGVATGAGHFVAGLVLALFAVYFFLREGDRIWHFMVRITTPAAARKPVQSAGHAAWDTLVSYVRATALVAGVDAVGIGIAVWALGVPLPIPLAALVFLGAFIPIVGSGISGTVAVLVALVAKGPVTALLVLAAVVLVMQLEGHVLQPLILGKAVAVHPLAVILVIAAGFIVAGIFGALIAVPVTAVLNTAIRHLAAVARGEAPPKVPDRVVT